MWNLALAWIPLLAALALDVLVRSRRVLLATGAALTWLVFLPNAPYLVSDIAHFDRVSPTPWLDLARLVAFAWAGCLLCVLSIRAVHAIVAEHAGRLAGWGVVVASAGASGVGVSLGRFAHLNSWEVVTRPSAVVDEAARLAQSAQAQAVAAFFAVLVLVVYTTLATAELPARPTRPPRTRPAPALAP